jgi:uncharacterized membrane protein YoaK (UPF0700 family)
VFPSGRASASHAGEPLLPIVSAGGGAPQWRDWPCTGGENARGGALTDRADSGGRQTGIWRAFVADPKHGPLPALLLILTIVTGTVDAVSILSLGRVFVANMTGNVVFVGFAIAGAPGFSLSASLFALAGFLIGAYGGGVAIGRHGANRAVLFRDGLMVELAFLIVALVTAALSSTPFDGPVRDAIAITAAIGLGVQNAVVRRLAVPDLTTTVLTMTLTGIAADVRKPDRVVVLRRVLAVVTMLGGAVVGALLVLHVSAAAALGLSTGLLGMVAICAVVAARRPAGWQA